MIFEKPLPDKQTIIKYRNKYSNSQAKQALFDQLCDLGLFSTNPGSEDNRSYAIRLLTILGGGHISESAVTKFISALIGQEIRNDIVDLEKE